MMRKKKEARWGNGMVGNNLEFILRMMLMRM